MTEAIDKKTAAERLIVAAIKMSERSDDPLAVHVVAASALNMLRELIKAGGDDYAAWVLKEGIFQNAKARIEGKEIILPTTPEAEELIDKVVAGIEAGEVNEPSDIIIDLSANELWTMLDYITRPYNFLKHADRDPLETLDPSDVDPDGAIIQALTAFSMLEPEMQLPDEVAPYLAKHGLA